MANYAGCHAIDSRAFFAPRHLQPLALEKSEEARGVAPGDLGGDFFDHGAPPAFIATFQRMNIGEKIGWPFSVL